MAEFKSTTRWLCGNIRPREFRAAPTELDVVCSRRSTDMALINGAFTMRFGTA